MRKKHFTGVLMLAAAVTLGTVSPITLPNTAVVVKAAVNGIEDAGSKLVSVQFDAIGARKVKIHGVGIASVLGNTFTYGFGTDEATAVAEALKDEAKKVVLTNEAMELTIPNETALTLVILDKDQAETGGKVLGTKVTFSKDDVKPAGVTESQTDVEDIDAGSAGLEYHEAELDSNDLDAGWVTVGAGNKVSAPAIEAGSQKTVYFRKKGSGTTLASTVAAVTYTKTKKIGLEDLKALGYEVENNGNVKVSLAKSTIKDVVTKSGIAAYAVVDTSKLDSNTLTDADLTDANKLGEAAADYDDIAAVASGKSIVVYVAGAADRKTNFLAINVKQAEMPNLKQDGTKYRLINDGTYKLIEGMTYQYKLGGGAWTDAEVKKDGDTSYLEVQDHGNYDVRVKGNNGEKITFTDNKANISLSSQEKTGIVVNENKEIIGEAAFNNIKFKTINDNGLKVVVYDINQAFQNETTQTVKYSINGTNPTIISNAASTGAISTSAAVKAGDVFTIEVEGNPALKKTISFVGIAAHDGTPFAKKYQSQADIINAMGGASNIGSYMIREVTPGAVAAQATGNVYSKTGKYEISYYAPTAVGNIAFGAGENMFKYVLQGTVEVFLQTPEDAAKENQGGGIGPVIPGGSSGGTSGGGTTEPKKDEPKKDETKKSDDKMMDGDKKSDDKMMDKKMPEAVKDTKKNTVMASAEQVEKALESGLKVTSKSGEVKLSVSDLKKVVGDSAKEVTVTLRPTSTKATAKAVTKKLKGSKLVKKTVYDLIIKSGDTAVRESQMKGSKIAVTLKVKLSKNVKTVWVLDLSSGKRVKATYKNGKITFKTANLGKFVLVNKAK